MARLLLVAVLVCVVLKELLELVARTPSRFALRCGAVQTQNRAPSLHNQKGHFPRHRPLQLSLSAKVQSLLRKVTPRRNKQEQNRTAPRARHRPRSAQRRQGDDDCEDKVAGADDEQHTQLRGAHARTCARTASKSNDKELDEWRGFFLLLSWCAWS